MGVDGEDGSSGNGHVGGGEGGGRSSKKRGRGLGTMKSEEETMDDSDNAGEALRRGGGVEEANMSGDGVEGRVGETKGRKFGCAGMGDTIDKAGGAGERERKLGLAFSLSVVDNGEVFGRGGGFPEETVTAGGEGRTGNVMSEESDRVEGVKRTPYERGAGSAELGACSREWDGDRARVSGLCGRGA
jgi:hypothetical protein